MWRMFCENKTSNLEVSHSNVKATNDEVTCSTSSNSSLHWSQMDYQRALRTGKQNIFSKVNMFTTKYKQILLSEMERSIDTQITSICGPGHVLAFWKATIQCNINTNLIISLAQALGWTGYFLGWTGFVRSIGSKYSSVVFWLFSSFKTRFALLQPVAWRDSLRSILNIKIKQAQSSDLTWSIICEYFAEINLFTTNYYGSQVFVDRFTTV